MYQIQNFQCECITYQKKKKKNFTVSDCQVRCMDTLALLKFIS